MSHNSSDQWSHFRPSTYPRPPPSASVDRSASFTSSTFPVEDQPSHTEGGYSDEEVPIDQDEGDDEDANESVDDQEPEDGSDEALSDAEFEEKMESQLGLWRPTEQEFRASKDLLVSWDWNEETVNEPSQGQVVTERELVAAAQKAMRRALYSLDRDQWKYDSRPADDQTFAPPFSLHSQRSQSRPRDQAISATRR